MSGPSGVVVLGSTGSVGSNALDVIGRLPEQLAALNRTNINVQFLTIEAAFTGSRETVYHAAMLDPHTGSELTLDQIRSLCDDLIEAHGMEEIYK